MLESWSISTNTNGKTKTMTGFREQMLYEVLAKKQRTRKTDSTEYINQCTKVVWSEKEIKPKMSSFMVVIRLQFVTLSL
jgi:hypothetical protein